MHIQFITIIRLHVNKTIIVKNMFYLLQLFSDLIFVMPIFDTFIAYPGPKYFYEYDYINAITLPRVIFNNTDFGMKN